MRPNCHISERIKGCCDICGDWPSLLHMPEELHGWYCADCCPACKAQPMPAAIPVPAPEEQRVDAAPQAA